jgi:prepilin-type N-terminal cleavage/methylation domain-containing protein
VSPSAIGRRLAREEGFTLIELLMAMVLLGILTAAFAVTLGTLMTQNATITNETVIQSQARTALNQLTKDLRQATLPTTTATSPFVTVGGVMSPTSITFYSPDETYSTGAPTAYHLREISYQLAGGTFERASAISSNTGGPPWTIPALGSWASIVPNVTSSTVFKYFDGNNPPNQTTNPVAVRTIEVTLTVSIPGTNRTYTYSDTASLRETEP